MKAPPAVLPLLLAAACAGRTAASPDRGTTRADYLRRAEAVCAAANAQRAALRVPTADADFAPYVTEVVKVAERAATALARIAPPAADAADLRARVSGPLATDLAAGHSYLAAVATGPASGRDEALSDLLAVVSRTRPDVEWMRGYGFVQCVRAVSLSPG